MSASTDQWGGISIDDEGPFAYNFMPSGRIRKVRLTRAELYRIIDSANRTLETMER